MLCAAWKIGILTHDIVVEFEVTAVQNKMRVNHLHICPSIRHIPKAQTGPLHCSTEHMHSNTYPSPLKINQSMTFTGLAHFYQILHQKKAGVT